MSLKVAKIIRVITNVLGVILLVAVGCLIVFLLSLWAANHFLSFAIVMAVALCLGTLVLRVWSSDIIEADKQEEDFFSKNGRYQTKREKEMERRKEELRY